MVDAKNPSFSILMSNYNNSKYIKVAIESVIAQTYPYWELIIIDDASKDNSLDIIKPYLNNDKIKLISHKKNMGCGQALKTGMKYVSNEIIGILDSDDKLHKRALELMAKAYQENPTYEFIYSNYLSCDSHLKNPRVLKHIGPCNPEESNLYNPKVAHFKTFRKELYYKTSGFDPELRNCVDKDIILKMEEITKFKFVNHFLYYYREHPNSISRNEFNHMLFRYIMNYKTYKRRLNTKMPNCTRQLLYLEYFQLTFYKLIKFSNNLKKLFKISEIIQKNNIFLNFLQFIKFYLNLLFNKIIKRL